MGEQMYQRDTPRPAPHAQEGAAGQARRDRGRRRTRRPARYLAVSQARAAGYKGDIVLGWDYVDEAFWKATGKRGVGVIWPTFSAPALRSHRRGH